MAGSKTNALENNWINLVLRNVAYTSPTTVYLGLMTGVTDVEAGTVTEVSTTSTSYARQAITFSAPSSRQTSNSGAVNFTQATGNWGTVTHWGIFDASTSGNMLYWGTLSSSRTVATGDTFTVPSASCVITETGSITTYLAHAMLNHVLRNTAYTPVATTYLSLLTAVTDGAAGTVTEVSGGSYARQSVTWSAASGGTTSNSGTITFPTASAGWGTVTNWGLYDASTTGNLLYYCTITTSKTVSTSETPSFAATTISIGED